MENQTNEKYGSYADDLEDTMIVVDDQPEQVPSCSLTEAEHNYSGPVTADCELQRYKKVAYPTRKILRNTGQEYVSSSGKIVAKRSPRLLENCRNECKENVSYEVQQEIFHHYWSLSSYQRRQAFVADLIEVHETKTVRKNKSVTNPRNRQFAYKYFLPVKNEKVVVCQKCFRSTLCESEQFIKTLIKKKQNAKGIFTGNDERGKHTKKSIHKDGELMHLITDFATSKKSKNSHNANGADSDELQISKSYKIKFEKIGSLEVLTRKRVYNNKK